MIARVMMVNGGKDRAAAEAAARNVRQQAIPELERAPGFRGGYWLHDPETGTVMSVVLWDGAPNADHFEECIRAQRWAAIAELGTYVTSVVGYDVIAQADDFALTAYTTGGAA